MGELADEEFVLNGFGNVLLEFIADDKWYTTTLFFKENYSFFSREIFHKYSPKQILIFQYGLRDKEGLNTWHFDLRKDLKNNHLNFDTKINKHSIKNKVPSNQDTNKLKKFFLHTIKSIPKKLKINIFYLEDGKGIENKKLIKSYELTL